MKILQIAPCFENIEKGVPLKLPTAGHGTTFRDDFIQGMALVEYDNGDTGIEWVVWNPLTREIYITSEFFNRDCTKSYDYES